MSSNWGKISFILFFLFVVCFAIKTTHGSRSIDIVITLSLTKRYIYMSFRPSVSKQLLVPKPKRFVDKRAFSVAAPRQ